MSLGFLGGSLCEREREGPGQISRRMGRLAFFAGARALAGRVEEDLELQRAARSSLGLAEDVLGVQLYSEAADRRRPVARRVAGRVSGDPVVPLSSGCREPCVRMSEPNETGLIDLTDGYSKLQVQQTKTLVFSR